MMSDSSALIDSLTDPRAYPELPDEVRVFETHMSWVLLAGGHAYKIKKPIDLAFADFSTLDRRGHFCREEIRLNRRLAPRLYLGVVPIYGSSRAPRFVPGGNPIEYAVKMERFDQRQLLPQVLGRGELTAEHIERLAADVADFHQRVEVAGEDTRFGRAESIRMRMEDNFHELLESGALHDGRAEIRRLREVCRHSFDRRCETFRARKAAGFVRECHGDMHLGNMVLLDDEVVVFDAIEFNEDLRWIDVLSEIAFAAMDLAHRGRHGLSGRFVNRYLERTGDYEHLELLPFYTAYRALVRAKVGAIRAAQERENAGREEPELLGEVERYIALAGEAMSAPAPRLLITHGPSGSGKTAGSTAVVERGGYVRIRSDVERKRLAGLQEDVRTESRFEEGLYSVAATRACYRRLAELAAAILRAGYSVIVDAAFLKRWQRDLFRATARRCGVPWRIVEFRAPVSVLRARVTRRSRTASDPSEADLAVLEKQLASAEPLSASERESAVIVGTDTEPPEAVKARVVP